MKAAGTTLIFFVLLAAGCGGEGGETEVYEVPSESMEPTYSVGEELTVELEAYDDDEPEVGDVVVFHPPSSADNGSGCGVKQARDQACPQPTAGLSEQSFLKRVVATPGDELSFDRGLPVVNGERVLDDVIRTCSGGAGLCDFPAPIVIPPEHYFMLGDNSGASDDSRFWGPVPLAAILGRVEE